MWIFALKNLTFRKKMLLQIVQLTPVFRSYQQQTLPSEYLQGQFLAALWLIHAKVYFWPTLFTVKRWESEIFTFSCCYCSLNTISIEVMAQKSSPLPHAKKSGNTFDSNQKKISCVLAYRFLSLEKNKSIILMLKKILQSGISRLQRY